ncbi:hypothetical protein INR49_006983, partial [Caranx melampygus]
RVKGPVVSLGGATAARPLKPTHCWPFSEPRPPSFVLSVRGVWSHEVLLQRPGGMSAGVPPPLSLPVVDGGCRQRECDIELSGQSDGFVSFALSLDRWMGNDDVYLCVRDGGRGLHQSCTRVWTNPLEQETQAGRGVGPGGADGVIQCRFHRNVILQNRFDLNQSYFCSWLMEELIKV